MYVSLPSPSLSFSPLSFSLFLSPSLSLCVCYVCFDWLDGWLSCVALLWSALCCRWVYLRMHLFDSVYIYESLHFMLLKPLFISCHLSVCLSPSSCVCGLFGFVVSVDYVLFVCLLWLLPVFVMALLLQLLFVCLICRFVLFMTCT